MRAEGRTTKTTLWPPDLSGGLKQGGRGISSLLKHALVSKLCLLVHLLLLSLRVFQHDLLDDLENSFILRFQLYWLKYGPEIVSFKVQYDWVLYAVFQLAGGKFDQDRIHSFQDFRENVRIGRKQVIHQNFQATHMNQFEDLLVVAVVHGVRDHDQALVLKLYARIGISLVISVVA